MRLKIGLLLLPVLLFSAGMDLPCIGAKALGMGGAFRAIADDSTVAQYLAWELSVSEELPDDDFFARIGAFNFVPTFAYKPADWFSVGI